jgi:hypothetical protein
MAKIIERQITERQKLPDDENYRSAHNSMSKTTKNNKSLNIIKLLNANK